MATFILNNKTNRLINVKLNFYVFELTQIKDITLIFFNIYLKI